MNRLIISFFILFLSLLTAAQVEVVDSFGSNLTTLPTININPNSNSLIEVQEDIILYNNNITIQPNKKPIKTQKNKKPIKKIQKPIKNKISKKVIQSKVSKKIDKKDKKSKKTTTKLHSKFSKKPKLVIIMDDISQKWQLKKLKSLGIKVTPSIFPPNKMNMKNHLLSRNLKHFMVHLPLESRSKQMNKMHKTIFCYYTTKQIQNRVKEIRRLFPNAKYINNHTGSKFSENYRASKKLYKALINNGFIFIDSKTSKKSRFGKIAKEFNRRYLKSDHFIDNKLSVKATLKEIKRGVQIAKQKGYAIIIGHPHLTTFKALQIAKKGVLKQVKLIYIDEL